MKPFFRLDTPNNISNVATPGPCDGMVDITDLKSVAFGRGGSSPPEATKNQPLIIILNQKRVYI